MLHEFSSAIAIERSFSACSIRRIRALIGSSSARSLSERERTEETTREKVNVGLGFFAGEGRENARCR